MALLRVRTLRSARVSRCNKGSASILTADYLAAINANQISPGVIMKPSVLLLSAALSVLVCASVAQAQQWSDEQLEVWTRVETCVNFFYEQNADGLLDCIHDDFSGFLYGEPIPRGKNNFATIGRYFMENIKVAASEMRPLDIIVRDDFAIVHYYGFTVYEGSMEVSQDRWTDILVREDGVWKWIADHGGTVPTDDD